MFQDLDRQSRLRLMKFVCTFAWADLTVREQERAFVARMIDRLGMESDERRKVRAWLEVPPEPESVDPSAIPFEHRKLFIEAIEGVIIADGVIAPEERENLHILNELLS